MKLLLGLLIIFITITPTIRLTAPPLKLTSSEKKATSYTFPKAKNGAYASVLSSIRRKKDVTANSSLSLFFFNAMVTDIFPYWYGTEWDFNGYTNVPNEGQIACGYFVSTTLKHAGLNVNRYKFAQQYSLKEVKTLDTGYISLTTTNVDSVRRFCLKSLEEGLYIVGLDNHVGFLVLKQGELYFVHSDPSMGVMHEKATESPMMQYSRNFYIGKISNNPWLLRCWKQNTFIPIRD